MQINEIYDISKVNKELYIKGTNYKLVYDNIEKLLFSIEQKQSAEDNLKNTTNEQKETQEVFANTIQAWDTEVKDIISVAGALYHDLSDEEAALDRAYQRVIERRKNIIKQKKTLRNGITYVMQLNNIQKIKSDCAIVCLKKNPPRVQISDRNLIPREFIKTSIEESIDSLALSKTLKNGAEVPGAFLIQEVRVDIK
jgi:hypothetical protein